MIANVRARFSNGVLEPLEPLDLEEGREFMLTIDEAVSLSEGVSSLVDMFDKIRASASGVTWDDLPRDGARNVDHYLYGWPVDGES